MFFEIEKDSLLDALSKTVSIAEKKSTLPILSHVLMNAQDSQLQLTVTDLAIGLRIFLNCTVTEPGIVTVPCRKFYEIMREAAPGIIGIHLSDGNRIRITSRNSIVELTGMDYGEYPGFPSYDDVESGAIESEKLLTMVDRTLYASSTDEARFNLNGILFEPLGEELRLVATDGHRLALVDANLGSAVNRRVLVSRRGVTELRRILEGLSEQIQIGFDEKNMVIRSDRFLMTIRLIEAEFPDYRKVIPQDPDRIVTANRADILQALRRVQVLTSDRNKGIEIIVKPAVVEVIAIHPDLGSARDSIAVEYDGEEFSRMINVSYMIEALGTMDDAETILMEFYGQGGPIILRPVPPQGYFNLVMPMRR